MKCVNQEIKPHWGSLWGKKHWCVPEYCGIAEGDGKQVVWLKTGDSRPNYYILRVDSKTEVEGDDFDIETLYTCVEESFGNVNDYEELFVDGERKYKYFGEEELINEDEVGFPMLSTGNGAFWGVVKNFG